MPVNYKPLEAEFKNAIKERFIDKFQDAKWKSKAFHRYTADENEAKTIVLAAVHRILRNSNLDVDQDETVKLAGYVGLATTPQQILPAMVNAVRKGLKCPPGQTAEFEVITLRDGSVVRRLTCK